MIRKCGTQGDLPGKGVDCQDGVAGPGVPEYRLHKKVVLAGGSNLGGKRTRRFQSLKKSKKLWKRNVIFCKIRWQKPTW